MINNHCSRANCKEPAHLAELCKRHYEKKYWPKHRVYAILADMEPKAVKIGISAKPRMRMAGMQVDCPVTLDLLGDIPGSLELEARLHSLLSDYKIRGEWFWYEGEAKRVADAIAASNEKIIREFLARQDQSFEGKLKAISEG